MAVRINTIDYVNNDEKELIDQILKFNSISKRITLAETIAKNSTDVKVKMEYYKHYKDLVTSAKDDLKLLKEYINRYYSDASITTKKLSYKQLYKEVFTDTGIKI